MQFGKISPHVMFAAPVQSAPRPRQAAAAPARAGNPGDMFSGYDSDDDELSRNGPSGSWPPTESLQAARLRAWISSKANFSRNARALRPNPDITLSRTSAAPQDNSLQARLFRRLNALHMSAKLGNLQLVKYLLDQQVDVNARDEFGKTPLLAAVSGKQAQIVRLLLTHGADPNMVDFTGATPLHAAAAVGHWQIAFSLINANANPNAQDFYGATPLHNAASAGSPALIKLLLNHGARIDIADHMTQDALDKAIEHNHLPVLRLLLDRGINVNRRAPCGSTPLHTAVSARKAEVIEELLRRGAWPDLTDFQGLTANDHAFFTGDVNVLRALRAGEAHRDTTD